MISRLSKKKRGLLSGFIAAGGLLMSLATPPVFAANINVTTLADELDPPPGNGQCSLREAIVNANDNAQTQIDCPAGESGASGVTDVITLPAGNYVLTRTGVDERCENPAYYTPTAPEVAVPCTGTGTVADPYLPVISVDPGIGDLDITDDVSIIGAGVDQTIIQWAAAAPDNDPLTGDRIFHVQTAGANIGNVLFQDLSVVNGDVGVIPTAAVAGGGDLVIPDDVNAYDIEVVNPTSGSIDIWQFRRMGGAIALGAGYAVVRYEETLHGPGADSGGGEDMGPFPGGKTGEEEGYVIENVTLNRVGVLNSWSGADGGGIYSAVPADLKQVAISGNTGNANGGGIYNDAALSISDSLIGVVFDPNTIAAHPELTTPNVGENGGALFDTGLHTTSIVRSAINGNQAIGGGGIAGRAGIQILIDNSTVSGNTGTDVGGGITTNGTINLRNATIANNTATSDAPGGGAGLNSFGGGKFQMVNTVLANNVISSAEKGDRVANCGCSGGSAECTGGEMISDGWNIEDADTCNLFYLQGLDKIFTDARLAALANNGGLTETHALGSGSPAIDDGNNNVCSVLAAVYGVNVDQRGQPRVTDGNGDGVAVCDVGAFEAPGVSTSGGGSGGGGCAINPEAGFDPIWALFIFLSLGYVARRIYIRRR